MKLTYKFTHGEKVSIEGVGAAPFYGPQTYIANNLTILKDGLFSLIDEDGCHFCVPFINGDLETATGGPWVFKIDGKQIFPPVDPIMNCLPHDIIKTWNPACELDFRAYREEVEGRKGIVILLDEPCANPRKTYIWSYLLYQVDMINDGCMAITRWRNQVQVEIVIKDNKRFREWIKSLPIPVGPMPF